MHRHEQLGRSKAHLLCLVALAGLLLGHQAVAAASPVAEIIGINGQVQARLGGAAFAPAALMQRLGMRDAVRTQAASKAKLSFIDQSVLVLGEKATLEIGQYRLGEAERQPARILKVLTGKVRFIVHKFFSRDPLDPEVTLETPTIGVGIRGTDIIVAVQGATDYVYLLSAGTPVQLRSTSTGEQVDLKPGFYAISQAGQPIRIFPLTEEMRRQLVRELSLAFEVRPLGIPVEPGTPPEPLDRQAPVGPTQVLPPVYTPPVPVAPTTPHHGGYTP